MSNVNLGRSGIQGPAGPSPTESGAETPPSQETQIRDSISASDQMAALMYLMFLPQFPQLIPPDNQVIQMTQFEVAKQALLSFVSQMYKTLSTIIQRIGDAWSRSIKEQAKNNEKTSEINQKSEEDRKLQDLHSLINQQANDTGGVSTSIATERSLRATLSEGLTEYTAKVKGGNPAAQANFPFVSASFMIAASFFKDFVSGVGSLVNTSFDAVNSIRGAFASYDNSIPGNMSAELGLIGAMFGVGATYQAQIDSIIEKAPARPKNADFARNYALKILQIVDNKSLDSFISTLIDKKIQGGAIITNPGKEQFTAMVKTVLLSVSLALLYKLGMSDNLGGTHWIRGPEFVGMLEGNIPVRAGQPEAQLIEQIKTQLQVLPGGNAKNPGLREKFSSSVIAYMDSNPDVDSLLDVGKVLEDVYTTIPHAPSRG